MARIYRDKDASLAPLKGKTIAVIGFGAQGKAQAQCFKGAGVKTIIGLRSGSKSKKIAEKLGFKVLGIKEATEKADVICVLIPDEKQKACYEKEIMPALAKGKTLCFAHGFAVTFGLIRPPKGVCVIMVAPNATGPQVREGFVSGKGVPGMLAVRQGGAKAFKLALAMAKALRLTRKGVLRISFEQETFSDLFVEQTVIVGGLIELIKAGYEVLVRKGYPPELAYISTMIECKQINDLINSKGIEALYGIASNTCEYGARKVGKKVIGVQAKKEMAAALKRIESGAFVKEFLADQKNGGKKLRRLKKIDSKSSIEKTGARIRKLFFGKNR